MSPFAQKILRRLCIIVYNKTAQRIAVKMPAASVPENNASSCAALKALKKRA